MVCVLGTLVVSSFMNKLTFATVYSTTFLSAISDLLPTKELVDALGCVSVNLLQPLLYVVESCPCR